MEPNIDGVTATVATGDFHEFIHPLQGEY